MNLASAENFNIFLYFCQILEWAVRVEIFVAVIIDIDNISSNTDWILTLSNLFFLMVAARLALMLSKLKSLLDQRLDLGALLFILIILKTILWYFSLRCTLEILEANDLVLNCTLDVGKGYIVRVLNQCWFCVLSNCRLENEDGHTLSTMLLSQFHKLFSIESLIVPVLTH